MTLTREVAAAGRRVTLPTGADFDPGPAASDKSDRGETGEPFGPLEPMAAD